MCQQPCRRLMRAAILGMSLLLGVPADTGSRAPKPAFRAKGARRLPGEGQLHSDSRPSGEPPARRKEAGHGSCGPILSDREAWQHLPRAETGAGQPLPIWARALAPSLPRTTAAMLELDYLHRARGPLAPLLRGKMRWIVAHATGCAYTKTYATADLLRAGLEAQALRALAGGQAERVAPERAALAFARKLTRDPKAVTDKEVAQLIRYYGEKRVVAMVLLVAHANFQDRLLLALALSPEGRDPLPPLKVGFRKPPLASRSAAPPRRCTKIRSLNLVPQSITDPDWQTLDWTGLQGRLARQQECRARIRLPGDNRLAIRWGLVSRAYQPELATAWAACLRAFAQEADQDQVFEQSVFWIITRSQHCFY
jgi:alkylhydroperoxidase family enzyme